jgi:hypothetical protein
MGSVERRLDGLEDHFRGVAAETEADEKLRRERAIMRMILDEFARLKASDQRGDPASLERAVHNVTAEQYADLGKENYEYIAEGWIETLGEWTRLDWMAKAGRMGPPHA